MRTSNGFDRMSTEEELHQVLNVLGDLERNGWMIPEEPLETSQASDLWAEALLDDSTDAESLAELVEKRPKFNRTEPRQGCFSEFRVWHLAHNRQLQFGIPFSQAVGRRTPDGRPRWLQAVIPIPLNRFGW